MINEHTHAQQYAAIHSCQFTETMEEPKTQKTNTKNNNNTTELNESHVFSFQLKLLSWCKFDYLCLYLLRWIKCMKLHTNTHSKLSKNWQKHFKKKWRNEFGWIRNTERCHKLSQFFPKFDLNAFNWNVDSGCQRIIVWGEKIVWVQFYHLTIFDFFQKCMIILDYLTICISKFK